MTATSAPQYDTPDWGLVDGTTQTLRCGKHGVRREQDTRHAAWIRREATKRGLKAHVSLTDGAVHVRLAKVEGPDTYSAQPNAIVAKDREVAYEQNVTGLEIAFRDRIDEWAGLALEKAFEVYGREDSDGVRDYAIEALGARLLNISKWEGVEAADISDIAYEAVNRRFDSY